MVKILTHSRLFKFASVPDKVYSALRRGLPIHYVIERYGIKPYAAEKFDFNVILDEGASAIWSLLTGSTSVTPFDNSHSYIGVGDGTEPEDPSQTGLTGTNKYYKLVDSGYPMISGRCIVFRATFDTNEANFSWNEWTIANGPSDDAINLNRKQVSMGTKQLGEIWVLNITLCIE